MSELLRPGATGPDVALARRAASTLAWSVVAVLPLVGLASLLRGASFDPQWASPRVHFVLFLAVGLVTAGLAYAAGEAAERRGDARVLLLSLAFLATGGFMGLHAVGTRGVLVTRDLAGFKIAITVGLIVAAVFGTASAFVDVRPTWAATVLQWRRALRRSVLVSLLVWWGWTLAQLPPLTTPGSEGSSRSLLGVLAAVGTVLYAVSAARYLVLYRSRPGLLTASVVACFVLLAQALIGVATTGERSWHASWWEWHMLIVLAYAIVLFAARREWRGERFRDLYLATTRERAQDVSVLVSDLAGYTSFTEGARQGEVAEMLHSYYAVAAPLISRRFGGELEKFTGDGIFATFNSRGDQPDHAARAAGAALALQTELGALADRHEGWCRLRVGVNSGAAEVREMGGHGFVAYTVVGDTVNLAARLEGQAPVGGVLIGEGTYLRLPAGTRVQARPGLRVKGKQEPVDAYVLEALPEAQPRRPAPAR